MTGQPGEPPDGPPRVRRRRRWRPGWIAAGVAVAVLATVLELRSGMTAADVRRSFAAEVLLSGADKQNWRDGAVWTLRSPDEAVLYWDAESKRVAGVAELSFGGVATLRSWWEARFGR